MSILSPAKLVVLLALLFSEVTTGKSLIPSLEPELDRQELGDAGKSDVALAMQPAGTSDKSTPIFAGIAAGDMTASSVILWTRTFDPVTKKGMAARIKVQVSTNINFTTIPFAATVTTDPNRDYTVKVEATKLQSGTRYYYRFGIPKGGFSTVGTFKTAPNPTSLVPVRFGFSGDADGQWRPYSSTLNFNKLGLDYFVFLGDTIYETASKGSPATADPVANPAQALTDYRRKYLESIQAINLDGFAGLKTLYGSQGNYTLLDNHELGNKQLINGGASAALATALGNSSSNPIDDTNKTGTFLNQTTGFKTLLRAYSEYQPIREKIVSAPGDKRTDGTQQLYFAQQWGRNTIFVNVDTRSYRDVRLKALKGGDDTGVRADNPDRTMLGSTQLAWLKRTLLAAQKNGTTWKFIAISSPIDKLGAVGSGDDGGKSWSGGYRAERNNLLKFIADNNIKNTVFLAADDHQNRVNELTYLDNPKDLQSVRILPAALAIVAGPIGAGGPDLITNHSFGYLKNIADTIAQNQQRAGVNPIGLDPRFPGLRNVIREGDPLADKLRQPIDFYSPDTFNYAILDVSADGKTLSVNIQGINSFPKGTFPEPSTANPLRSILSFKIDRS
jgi:phosphodiesterase/alkaline phosphatase D-like protein